MHGVLASFVCYVALFVCMSCLLGKLFLCLFAFLVGGRVFLWVRSASLVVFYLAPDRRRPATS